LFANIIETIKHTVEVFQPFRAGTLEPPLTADPVDLSSVDGIILFDCAIRIGLNTGPVVAGVIGKRKFSYDLWGDAVNVASRMESHGLPGRIHLTESTYRLLEHAHSFESRGAIDIKGKGAMNTFLNSGGSDSDGTK
jgi:class 3 adenylate cyclase